MYLRKTEPRAESRAVPRCCTAWEKEECSHTAMMVGRIAAHTAIHMFAAGNLSEEACEAYELRCYDAFGYEFLSSWIAARVIYYFPIALDAVAVVRRGQAFLDFFGETMTGVRPKSDFVKDPLLLLEIGVKIVRQCVLQYVWRIPPLVPQDIGRGAVDKQAKKK